LTKNYYKILGVDKGSDQDDIKKAYRTLSKEHHPDKGGDEEKFKEINEAYSTLSNPEKKAGYDNPAPHGFRHPFGDIFGGMGPMQAPNPNAPRRGRNIVLEHEVPLGHFIIGGAFKVKFSFTDSCPDCGGTGAEERETCSVCKGVGQIIESSRAQGIFMQSARACPRCMGRGFTASKKCESCKGVATRQVNKDLELGVPAGSHEGSVVGITGEGHVGANGGPAGDLMVKLHMKLPKVDELTDEQKRVLKEL
jgi:molecular chaperone DnaJ